MSTDLFPQNRIANDAAPLRPGNDLATVGAVQSLMRRIDNLLALAVNPHVCDELRKVERRNMQEAVERELLIARRLRMH